MTLRSGRGTDLPNRLNSTPATDTLSETLSALADPTRRAILSRLSRGEASVTELAAPFEMSLPAVSKHLRVLQRAKLISRGKSARRRPCKLDATPLKEVDQWVGRYRQFWEESYGRLDDYLNELKGGDVPYVDADES